MNLQEIVWPVFKLSNIPPLKHEKVSYFISEYLTPDDGITHKNVRLVDDLSIEQPTLGKRRLLLKQYGVALWPIKRAIYFLADLIKLATPTTWFIDSAGKIFQHTKKTRTTLVCKKITKIQPLSTIGTVVEVSGIASRFKVLYPPKPNETYAGLLKVGLGYIFYGFYSEPFKNSWRLV